MSAPARWVDGPMLGFDLETSGPDPDTARIVTAATIMLGPVLDEDEGFRDCDEGSWLVRQTAPIPAAATAVHGITTEHAWHKGRPAPGIVKRLADAVTFTLSAGIPVVGHNLSYDLTVLDRECRRHDLPPLVVAGPLLDTLVLDKAVDRYRRGKRTLTATCEHYGVTLGDGAHDAAADARAACGLAIRIGQAYPRLASTALAGLHEQQQAWRAEQCASLQEYLRRRDPAAVVDGTWPVHPLPDGWDPAAVPEEDPA